MYPRNWSPARKANTAILAALALALMAYATNEVSSPAPQTDLSRPAVPTLMAISPSVGLSTEAPVHPRSLHRIRLAADKTLRDDHWGECAAFTHYHPTAQEYLDAPVSDEVQSVLNKHNDDDDGWSGKLDGLCHSDLTDEPVKTRPVLPKPAKPDPKRRWL